MGACESEGILQLILWMVISFLKDVVFSSVKWVHPYTDPKLSKSNNTLIFIIPLPVAASAVFLHLE